MFDVGTDQQAARLEGGGAEVTALVADDFARRPEAGPCPDVRHGRKELVLGHDGHGQTFQRHCGGRWLEPDGDARATPGMAVETRGHPRTADSHAAFRVDDDGVDRRVVDLPCLVVALGDRTAPDGPEQVFGRPAANPAELDRVAVDAGDLVQHRLVAGHLHPLRFGQVLVRIVECGHDRAVDRGGRRTGVDQVIFDDGVRQEGTSFPEEAVGTVPARAGQQGFVVLAPGQPLLEPTCEASPARQWPFSTGTGDPTDQSFKLSLGPGRPTGGNPCADVTPPVGQHRQVCRGCQGEPLGAGTGPLTVQFIRGRRPHLLRRKAFHELPVGHVVADILLVHEQVLAQLVLRPAAIGEHPRAVTVEGVQRDPDRWSVVDCGHGSEPLTQADAHRMRVGRGEVEP